MRACAEDGKKLPLLVYPGRCLLNPESGLCEAYIPSYFYNSTSGQCEMFVYGGCQGNENRFSSGPECLRTCDPDSKCCEAT